MSRPFRRYSLIGLPSCDQIEAEAPLLLSGQRPLTVSDASRYASVEPGKGSSVGDRHVACSITDRSKGD